MSALTRRRLWWSKLFKEELPGLNTQRCVQFRMAADGRLWIEIWEEGANIRPGLRLAILTAEQRMELWNLLTHGKEPKPKPDPSKKKGYPPLRLPKSKPAEEART